MTAVADYLKEGRYDEAEDLTKRFASIIKCWGWQEVLEQNKARKDGSAQQRELWKGKQGVC